MAYHTDLMVVLSVICYLCSFASERFDLQNEMPFVLDSGHPILKSKVFVLRKTL